MSDDPNSPAPRPRRSSPDDPYSILAYLLSGPLVWGGVGLLLDRWLGTGFFVVLGLLLGIGAALYLVWLRYGRP